MLFVFDKLRIYSLPHAQLQTAFSSWSKVFDSSPVDAAGLYIVVLCVYITQAWFRTKGCSIELKKKAGERVVTS